MCPLLEAFEDVNVAVDQDEVLTEVGRKLKLDINSPIEDVVNSLLVPSSDLDGFEEFISVSDDSVQEGTMSQRIDAAIPPLLAHQFIERSVHISVTQAVEVMECAKDISASREGVGCQQTVVLFRLDLHEPVFLCKRH